MLTDVPDEECTEKLAGCTHYLHETNMCLLRRSLGLECEMGGMMEGDAIGRNMCLPCLNHCESSQTEF